MLLSGYLATWLPARTASLRPATAACYALCVKHISAAPVYARELSEITPLDCVGAYAPLLSAGRHRSAQLVHVVLNMALGDAVRMQYISSNPMATLRRPQYHSPEIEYLSPAQAALLLDRAKEYKAAWALMILAGLRKGEAAALTWDNVNTSNLVIKASVSRVGGLTHTGSPKSLSSRRTIPLAAKLSSILSQQRLTQKQYALSHGLRWSPGWLVISTDGQTIPDTRILNRMLRADLFSCGLPGITVHGLRHTFGASAVRAGIEMRILQKLLGHSAITVTAKYYAHVDEDVLQDAASKICALVT